MMASAAGSMSIMISVSLSARLSPRARTEQGGMRDAARAQVALVLAKPVKDLLPVHADLYTTKGSGIDLQIVAEPRAFRRPMPPTIDHLPSSRFPRLRTQETTEPAPLRFYVPEPAVR